MTRGSIRLTAEEPFSLDLTLGCGQAFRWRKNGPWWTGIVGEHLLHVRQERRVLSFLGAPAGIVRHYFSLDLDLPLVLSTIDHDPVIHSAIASCEGLRLLRQEPFECLVSYICATCANIPVIKRRVNLLAAHFGSPLPGNDHTRRTRDIPAYRFPDASRLSRAGEMGLTSCMLGYRARYIAETATAVLANPGWEDEVHKRDYKAARQYLMDLRGVGPKVADCVLLFGFGRYEAFPVDTWIQRIISRQYFDGRALSPREVHCFGREYFGRYAGYAQEYLYCCRDALGGDRVQPSPPA